MGRKRELQEDEFDYHVPEDIGDVFVTAQLQCRGNKHTPERLLLVAVFVDAIRVLCNGPGRRWETKEAYRETRLWIASEAESWPFAFASLCRHLGADPEYMREKLLAILPGHRVDLSNRASSLLRPASHMRKVQVGPVRKRARVGTR